MAAPSAPLLSAVHIKHKKWGAVRDKNHIADKILKTWLVAQAYPMVSQRRCVEATAR